MSSANRKSRLRLPPIEGLPPWPELRDWARGYKQTHKLTWIDVCEDAGAGFYPSLYQYFGAQGKTPSNFTCSPGSYLYVKLADLRARVEDGSPRETPLLVDPASPRGALVHTVEPILEAYSSVQGQYVGKLDCDTDGGLIAVVSGSDDNIKALNIALTEAANTALAGVASPPLRATAIGEPKYDVYPLTLAWSGNVGTPPVLLLCGGTAITTEPPKAGLGTLGLIVGVEGGVGVTVAHVIVPLPFELNIKLDIEDGDHSSFSCPNPGLPVLAYYDDPSSPRLCGACYALDTRRDVALVHMSGGLPYAADIVSGIGRVIWPNMEKAVNLRAALEASTIEFSFLPPERFKVVTYGVQSGMTHGVVTAVMPNALVVEPTGDKVAVKGDSGSCWVVQLPKKWRGIVVGFTSHAYKAHVSGQGSTGYNLVPVWGVLQVMDAHDSSVSA